ncbi:tubulin/FtsZ family, GTPase domain-containing protein [Toxoplasma gondii TgCatPRC2]|uniref:Tubulin/FtsZ family, GTPase domain-containing protein n=3 Tax=Toxoplasma gondii TaxID=5811 RepID=A0A151H0J7_TOXGO|nr:tubulin/FtsZ family, GTPase domain-containing protein [Toxoplasma gondii FOU]KFG47521.1 tubulin/FtsZ family, GTPase domain-containing protein [Toxoplasma gondii p89]KYK62859.1 tubulin/FtsZ family, GTPase domain-containing protein [Toxoplasma gondii TgCatPRC2]
MPREVFVVQIGQCGNQIGGQFWETLLEEHAAAVAREAEAAKKWSRQNASYVPRFSASMSTFFRNVNARHHACYDLGDGQPLRTLKARAILIDMEEGVLNELRRGSFGSLFDERHLISDVSGAGNNWAHGFCVYGPEHRDRIAESLRRSLEAAESPQGFLILHSLGGGTGSGLGSFVVQMLEEELPDLPRFCCSVVPSPLQADDVVTAPYNNLLSLLHLRRHASCVLPVSNDALVKMCESQRATPVRPDTGDRV